MIKPEDVGMRGWGSYLVIGKAPGHLVKRLVFKERGEMKFQRHNGRMERWVVVSGYGTMTLAGSHAAPNGHCDYHLNAGQMLAVPIETWHKFSAGPHGCTIIETWIGSDLSEKDIERCTSHR